ncbi:MAG: TonB-dependent receptor domain-containing protein, partial [bacterium]
DRSEFPEFFGPDVLINSAINNLDNTNMYEADVYTEKSFERDYTAQLNLKVPYTITSNVAGFIKFGGKYVEKTKNRDRSHGSDRLDNTKYGYEEHHTRYGTRGFEYIRLENGFPSIKNYLDPNFDAGAFLGGDYDFGVGLNGDEITHLLTSYLIDSTLEMSSLADLDDYELVEKVSAGYIMSEINIGHFLMFLPGIRYEHTRANMTGRKGNVPDTSFEPALDSPLVTDTTATATYGRWFPMIHIRIRPTSWFDIRLAYTKSLSRPRLDWMLPKKKVDGSDRVVTFGRPDLKPQIANNYDIFLSFYSNRVGLLTLGGFYKKIDDLIFNREGHKILNYEKEGYPKELQGYTLDQPENNPFQTKVKGFEIEWQMNLVWLPSPFDGIVINANYSHIWSETQFPRSFVDQVEIPVFPFRKLTVIDTFRVGDMPDQADDIVNIAIGYDKGPFSGRLSMLYQGKTLTTVGERPELDGFTADLLRWDLSIKYRLTEQIGLFVNWNNVTNEPDESFQQRTLFPTDREFYGWTTDFGIAYKF